MNKKELMKKKENEGIKEEKNKRFEKLLNAFCLLCILTLISVYFFFLRFPFSLDHSILLVCAQFFFLYTFHFIGNPKWPFPRFCLRSRHHLDSFFTQIFKLCACGFFSFQHFLSIRLSWKPAFFFVIYINLNKSCTRKNV